MGNPAARDAAGSESSHPALTESQRKQVLYEWNDTRADFPDACAHQLFEQQVARDPDAIAVVGGGKSLSYGELNQRANQVANYLRKRGVGPDVLVGVCLQRSPELVVALLGVWKAGGAYVPLDSSYPEDRLSFMVTDAAVRVLLTEDRCKQLFNSMNEKAVCLDSDWPAIALEDNRNLDSGATPSNLAYVMYTSGSTGKPKGAMILHRGLVNYLWWAVQTYKVQAGGSVPVHSSISFDLTVTSLYPALVSGGQVELLAEDIGAQNLLAAMRRRKDRNLVKITPAHLEALGLQLSAEEVAGMTRTFVIGGENLLAESLRLWRESAPATRLINEYGPTETVVGCCVYEVQSGDPRTGSVPIGRPIANTQLYILDENLEPVPPGVMGELFIGGAGVARGYLNRPDLTRERFLPNPFSAQISDQGEARMYKTGDLARYRDDGIIEYLGRVDNQVKVRGYRIELGEIEAVLASCPAVQSCAVLAREDTPGDKQLVGYVVSRESKAPAPEELQSYLKGRLPEYMVPAKFVYLDSFPLTHNGKVDRKALPAPLHEDARSDQSSARPRNATEEAVAAIWMEMFKIDNIGIHDDFFDLGGHSLLAIKVMSRIRDVLGVDLQVLNLFENPTIASLSDCLTQAGVPDAPARASSVDVAPAPLGRAAQPSPEPQAARPAAGQQEGRRTMTPFYFGADDAPLFGVYSPPNAAVARQCAVLLCAPISMEYMRSHYAMRIVGTQLARAGFPVLRFDYHGTGDSSGNVGAGQFDLWSDDIALAAKKLFETSGVRDLTVVGLRLGAAFAVEALASRNIKTKGLVLWDPVVSGGEYLSMLERMHAEATADRKVPLRPSDELMGTRYPRDLRTALKGLNIADRLQKVDVRRTALIVSEDLPRYGELLNSMQSRWPETIYLQTGDPVDWESLRTADEGRRTGPIIRAVAEAAESLS
jgi:amino acid adenylation domain-containing protein